MGHPRYPKVALTRVEPSAVPKCGADKGHHRPDPVALTRVEPALLEFVRPHSQTDR